MNNIKLELLTSPGCHNCKVFKAFWEPIANKWPNISYSEISILDPEGQKIAQKHMILASPGLLINDELFSTGGIDQDEFLAKIKELSA